MNQWHKQIQFEKKILDRLCVIIGSLFYTEDPSFQAELGIGIPNRQTFLKGIFFIYFRSFQAILIQYQLYLVFYGSRIRIIGVAGEHADHVTTTTAL